MCKFNLMKTLINPPYSDWEQYCERPVFPAEDLEEKVAAVLEEVRSEGDIALKRLTSVFDKVTIENIKVSAAEIEKASSEVRDDLKEAIAVAANNIRTFHSAQQITEATVETMPGIKCWRKSVAIEKVGLYIPGGSAPLFSTILMLGIPALIAGCRQIVLCTPPDRNGNINPAVL